MATQDTSALNPEFLALYNAQLPQVLLAAQQQMQAKGLFNSGNAADAATKAQADLMASLLAQQQAQVQQTSINQANINQAQSAQENATKAANRNTNMGLIGSGVAAAAGLGGMYAMRPGGWLNPGGMKNMFQSGGNTYTLDQNGKATLVQLPGQPSVGGADLAPGAGIGGPGTLPGPSDVMGGSVTPSMGSLPGTVPNTGAANPSTLTPSAWNAPGGANGMGGFNPGGADPAPNLFSGGGSPDLSNLAVAPSFSSSLDGLFSGGGSPDLSNLASSGGGAMSDVSNVMAGGLPFFAKGGIISKPTIAQIGDAGPGNPEEVIPLNKLQAAVGPGAAAKVMAAVPQPGTPGYGQPPAQPGMSPGVTAPPPPGMPPAPMPSMWSQPSAGGPVPPPAPISPLAALQSGGLLGNLFNRPRPA